MGIALSDKGVGPDGNRVRAAETLLQDTTAMRYVQALAAWFRGTQVLHA